MTRTRPSPSCQDTVSPSAPISASLPVTTGRLRERNRTASTSSSSAALPIAAPIDHAVGEGKARRARGEHHQRADDEGGDAADAERAEGADMGLGDHQRDAEEHQRRAGVVDRQKRERVERDEETDGADQARRDGARIEEFEDQPVDADEHEDEGDVRIGDEREQLGAPVGRHGHDVEAGGRQTLRLAGDGHRAPVDLAQKIGDVVGDHVDDVKRERLGGRQACGGTHGLGGPVGIAAVERGEAANIGDGVVDDLARLGVRRFAGFAFCCCCCFCCFWSDGSSGLPPS